MRLTAQFFEIEVDELLRLESGAVKRGSAPMLQRQIERVSRLAKIKQKIVMEMLEGVLSQANRYAVSINHNHSPGARFV